jgi:two-component system KDP operon response regulator KdpE
MWCGMIALLVGCGHDVVEDVTVALRVGWTGIEVVPAPTGRQALDYVQQLSPNLIVIHTETPDADWLDLLRTMRRFSGAVAVALSRRFDEGELVAAVEAGADDYIHLPLTSAQLVARFRAALRRVSRFTNGDECLATCGRLQMDPARHEAVVNGRRLRLTASEFKLLLFLVQREGRVARKESLRDLIWGENADVYGPCLRKYIQNLRRRLEETPDPKPSIVTVTKVGYRLVDTSS